MSKIFDTHVHYNYSPLKDAPGEFIAAAKKAGVTHACVVGTNVENSYDAIRLRSQHRGYFQAAIGLHPDVITSIMQEHDYAFGVASLVGRTHIEELRRMSQQKHFDAWGEIGLDFYHLPTNNHHADLIRFAQSNFFLEQLIMAASDERPIIFHIRDEQERCLDENGAYLQALYFIERYVPDKPLIFHCFSGAPEYLQRVLKLPHAYVSFAGNVTFKSAHALRDLVKMVPPERLLVETDAPYLSPEPHRGQSCEPAFIADTAQLLQQKLGVDLEQVYQNSLAIFRLSEV